MTPAPGPEAPEFDAMGSDGLEIWEVGGRLEGRFQLLQTDFPGVWGRFDLQGFGAIFFSGNLKGVRGTPVSDSWDLSAKFPEDHLGASQPAGSLSSLFPSCNYGVSVFFGGWFGAALIEGCSGGFGGVHLTHEIFGAFCLAVRTNFLPTDGFSTKPLKVLNF